MNFSKAIDADTYTKLLLSYGSHADYSSITSGTSRRFRNAIQFGVGNIYETSEASHKHENVSSLVKQGKKTDGSYTDKDFSADYDAVSGKLSYRLLFNTDGLATGEQTITDTLPAGTSFDDSSFTANFYLSEYYQNDTVWPSGGAALHISDFVTHEVTKNADGTSTLTIHIKAGYGNYAMAFQYSLNITDQIAGSTAYVNTVTCGGTVDTQTQTVKHTYKNVVKTAEQGTGTEDSQNVVIYRVTVNPLAADLDPLSSTLTLTDTLSLPADSLSDIYLLQNSVRLFAYDSTAKNGEGTRQDASALKFTYDAAAHKLVFTLPDSQALVVEYKYYFDLASGVSAASLTNSASLTGVDDAGDSKSITVAAAKDSATLVKQKLTIYKVDAENNQKTLAGASFLLEKWGGQSDQTWTGAGTYTTGTDGTFSFGDSVVPGLTLYRLTETAAPDGYALNSTPIYFVWGPEKDAGGTVYTLAALKTAMSGILTNSGAAQDTTQFYLYTGGSLYVSDKRNSIAVSKVWRNPDGSTGKAGSASVTVSLLKDGAVADTQTLNAGNSWTYIWKNLDTTAVYTVREENVPAGYAVSYDNNGGIAAGTITVTNTGTPATYTLPETGGPGTARCGAAGDGAGSSFQPDRFCSGQPLYHHDPKRRHRPHL